MKKTDINPFIVKTKPPVNPTRKIVSNSNNIFQVKIAHRNNEINRLKKIRRKRIIISAVASAISAAAVIIIVPSAVLTTRTNATDIKTADHPTTPVNNPGANENQNPTNINPNMPPSGSIPATNPSPSSPVGSSEPTGNQPELNTQAELKQKLNQFNLEQQDLVFTNQPISDANFQDVNTDVNNINLASDVLTKLQTQGLNNLNLKILNHTYDQAKGTMNLSYQLSDQNLVSSPKQLVLHEASEYNVLRSVAKTNIDLVPKSAGISRFQLALFSASITPNNYQTYFQMDDVNGYPYELVNISVNPENINQSILTFNLFSKDKKYHIKMVRTFNALGTNDLNTLINQIKTNVDNVDPKDEAGKGKLETLFDFPSNLRDTNNISQFNDPAFLNNFVSKYNHYFSFKINHIAGSDAIVDIYLKNNENPIKVSSVNVPLQNWTQQYDNNIAVGVQQAAIDSIKNLATTPKQFFTANGQRYTKIFVGQSRMTRMQLLFVNAIEKAANSIDFKGTATDSTDPNMFNKYERLWNSFEGPNFQSARAWFNSNNYSDPSWLKMNQASWNQIRSIALSDILNIDQTRSNGVVQRDANGNLVINNITTADRDQQLVVALNAVNKTTNVIVPLNVTLNFNSQAISDAEATLIKNIQARPLTYIRPKNNANMNAIMASAVNLNADFEPIQVPGYTLTLKPFNNPNQSVPYDDLNGAYHFAIELTRTGENTPIATVIQTNGNGLNIPNFVKQQDPIDDGSFNDAYFTTPNSADIQNQANQINGSDFALITTNGFSYLEPKAMTNQNIKYFLRFTGATPPAPTESEGDKNKFGLDNPVADKDAGISGHETSGTITVPPGQISNDPSSPVNINSLRSNYFFAYYDVKALNDKTVTFKIGFINKRNPAIRGHSKTVTLTNLGNKLADSKYLWQDLNNIRRQDLFVDTSNISGISGVTPQQFMSFINSKTPTVIDPNEAIRVKWSDKFMYQKYQSKRFINEFKIAEAAQPDNANGTLFVRFKYTNENNQTQTSNTWIQIAGFKKTAGTTGLDQATAFNNLTNTSLDVNNSNLFSNQNMASVQFDNLNVTRLRKLELAKKDATWQIDQDRTSATFTLDKKYYDPLLNNSNQPTIGDPIINLKFTGGVNNTHDRAFDFFSNRPIQISLNYNQLKQAQNQTMVFHKTAVGNTLLNNAPAPTINYTITTTLTASGLNVKLVLDNPTFKITDNYLQDVNTNVVATPQNQFGVLHNNTAFYLDYVVSNVAVRYTNQVANENFINYRSNLFDYNHVTFTQLNEPIILKGQPDNVDPFIFNPNQNLDYKWTQGYKMNLEYVSDTANYPGFDDVKARTFAGSYGSLSMLRKLTDDPNDYRYFMVTNNHVYDHPRNIFDPTPVNNPNQNFGITKHSNDFSNMYYNGFSYWGGKNVVAVDSKEFWDGKDQTSKDGKGKTSVDYAIAVVDIKSALQSALDNGQYDMYNWLSNWKNLKPLNISYDNQNWSPFQNGVTYDYSFSGFPYGNQASYLYRRLDGSISDNNYVFRGDGINPIYHDAGNSGTGVISNDGQYVAAINSGVPRALLVAWKLDRSGFDFWGGNADGISVLDKQNPASFTATYLRANAYDPVAYPLFATIK
ncbi:MGA_1079 family surface serine endopeptidase [[Mycoplasma] testudinis]|uniref:MGA_1079 family surface serine endopeptidase n=1 Tax=[Mycoplasma] testudinis TaxID=33924 RepID=UPI000481668C|nr:hypothetical protein [[Mycoplasma] testudinis]